MSCVSRCSSICASASMDGVSNLSIFFAQVLGVYLFVVFLSMLMHHQRHKRILGDFTSNHSLLALTGGLGLLFGLAIVVSHNVWVSDWPVLVTLTGWVAIVQGILRIFFPDAFAKLVKDMMSKTGYLIWCWVWFIIGLYLLWVGFGFSN